MNKKLNSHLELGKINTLKIDRDTAPGLYLMAEDEKDVLLPGQYVTNQMELGDLIDVFLYTDSEDRLVATTQQPTAMLDQFGYFEIVDITPFGAFVSWGLPKDLLVPKKFLKPPYHVGEKKILKIIYDEKSHRLIGTEKITNYLQQKKVSLKKFQEVSLLVFDKTPLGFKCIINNTYEGLLFHSEIFDHVTVGDTKTGYVKNVRKDGKVDLTLNKIGKSSFVDSANIILDLLQNNSGQLPYNYKTDPELIQNTFHISKKEFKKALTSLQEQHKILVKDTGIYLQR